MVQLNTMIIIANYLTNIPTNFIANNQTSVPVINLISIPLKNLINNHTNDPMWVLKKMQQAIQKIILLITKSEFTCKFQQISQQRIQLAVLQVIQQVFYQETQRIIMKIIHQSTINGFIKKTQS